MKTTMTFGEMKQLIDAAETEWDDVVPPNWCGVAWEDKDNVPAALLHYIGTVGRNKVPGVEAPEPKWSADDSLKADGYLRTDGAGAYYGIFWDGSFLYTNNAQDEVWHDWTDFVQAILKALRGVVEWEEISEMDRALLIEWAGSEEEARSCTES